MYILVDVQVNQIYQLFSTIFPLIRLHADTSQIIIISFQLVTHGARKSHLTYRLEVVLFRMCVVWECPHLLKLKTAAAL